MILRREKNIWFRHVCFFTYNQFSHIANYRALSRNWFELVTISDMNTKLLSRHAICKPTIYQNLSPLANTLITVVCKAWSQGNSLVPSSESSPSFLLSDHMWCSEGVRTTDSSKSTAHSCLRWLAKIQHKINHR